MQYRFREEKARQGLIRPLLAPPALDSPAEKQAAEARLRAQWVTGLGPARRRELAPAVQIRALVSARTRRRKAVSLQGQAVRDGRNRACQRSAQCYIR